VDVNNQMAQKMAAAVRGAFGRWPMELLGALLLAPQRRAHERDDIRPL